jgi:hypothetical protein
MTSPKHGKTTQPTDLDLTDDPGIKRSHGIKTPPEDAYLQGENTVEDDVANGTTPQGAVNPRQQADKQIIPGKRFKRRN